MVDTTADADGDSSISVSQVRVEGWLSEVIEPEMSANGRDEWNQRDSSVQQQEVAERGDKVQNGLTTTLESCSLANTVGNGLPAEEIIRAVQEYKSQRLQLSFSLETGHNFKEIATSTWCTETNIFICSSSSPLSSDYYNSVRPERFNGSSALSLMTTIPQNSALAPFLSGKMPELGERRCLSMRALFQAEFMCATQFIAALKAFEADDMDMSCCKGESEQHIAKLITGLLRSRRHTNILKDLYAAPLFKILRSNDVDRHKSFSKQLQAPSDKTWQKIVEIGMVAAIICRAKVCPIVGEIIRESEDRTFVKMSPNEDYWGYKCRHSKSIMFRPEAWRGKNRLGWCYERAREYLRKESSHSGTTPDIEASPTVCP